MHSSYSPRGSTHSPSASRRPQPLRAWLTLNSALNIESLKHVNAHKQRRQAPVEERLADLFREAVAAQLLKKNFAANPVQIPGVAATQLRLFLFTARSMCMCMSMRTIGTGFRNSTSTALLLLFNVNFNFNTTHRA